METPERDYDFFFQADEAVNKVKGPESPKKHTHAHKKPGNSRKVMGSFS